MNQKYKVIFTGKLRSETSFEEAQAAMMKGFRLSAEKATALLQIKRPLVIKKALQKDQGQKLCRRLSDIGLLVKLVREPNENAEHSTPRTPTPPDIPAAAPQGPSVNPYTAPEAQLETAETGKLHRGDPQKLSAGQGYRWLVDAFGMFKAHPLSWIGAVVVVYFCIGILSLIPVAGMFAGTFLSPILFGGMMLGAHGQAEGDDFLFKSVFAGFSNNRNQLLLLGLFSIVGMIACALPVVAVFGMTLFTGQFDPETMAAGSIVTFMLGGLFSALLTIPYYMLMWFSPTIAIVAGENAWSAMKLSFQATKKNMLPFLIYGVSLVAGVAVLGIGAAILIPSLVYADFVLMPLFIGLFALGALLLILPAAVIVMISIYTGYRSIFYR